eukprot:NODE_40_length_35084_cov_0.543519.p18 type:complete len:196 gc:universal NODE_40_length_35084_cov_0.543519:17498-18085(+)
MTIQIHSLALLEAVNGDQKTGYLVGKQNVISTCSTFHQLDLILQVWPGNSVIGLFYSDMLDESKVRDGFLLFNTTNFRLHDKNERDLDYEISSTMAEQAAINFCDTTDTLSRLQFSYSKFQKELEASIGNSKKLDELYQIVKPISDDKLREYTENLEELIQNNIAGHLLNHSHDLVDNLSTIKTVPQGPKRRKNK